VRLVARDLSGLCRSSFSINGWIASRGRSITSIDSEISCGSTGVLLESGQARSRDKQQKLDVFMSQKLKPCYRLDEIIVQISTTFAITKKHLPMRVVELLPHSHCLKIQILRAQTFLGDICEELSSRESVKKDLEAIRCQRKEGK
jgi:hypothetical protein